LFYLQIVLLTDVAKHPGKTIKQEFDDIVLPLVQPNEETSSSVEPAMMTHDDLAKTTEKTNFHLRIAEIVRENSTEAALIVMTLPMPKKDGSLPFGIYMAWLDITTRQMPPFLFIRGNQESVLTFYS
jgi:solute carrier family 12 sodium/potassium/chloride transporter 2